MTTAKVCSVLVAIYVTAATFQSLFLVATRPIAHVIQIIEILAFLLTQGVNVLGSIGLWRTKLLWPLIALVLSSVYSVGAVATMVYQSAQARPNMAWYAIEFTTNVVLAIGVLSVIRSKHKERMDADKV